MDHNYRVITRRDCIIQSSNVIVFHIHIHVLLQAHSIHIPHRKHTNTHIHTHIHTTHTLHTPHTNSPQREICVSVYGCVMVMQCLRCTQASLKDPKYCKGVIKPNFTYTYVIINHTWSIAIGTVLCKHCKKNLDHFVTDFMFVESLIL